MPAIHIHIINHTHWDREWFLSSVYTTHWIPTLIDKLTEISAANPDFRYLLDGQTLIIEDLLKAYPHYQAKVDQLIENGNLTIGPYYCQPDWKLTSGESLIRNLEFGRKDAAQFGPPPKIGWMVDTFGHISQAPQIHQLFGINAAYVWRGVPRLEPYFNWQGADGSSLFAVDLFGGYRNLYGVTHAPGAAETRLTFEIAKLAPYYPTPDIPLFDGYDLEDNPEDSVSFLIEKIKDNSIALLEATPESFVQSVRPKLDHIPTIHGELNSGKIGAIFPGVYSTRTYTRILSRDCAHLLYRWAEPLAVMAWVNGRPYAADQYETWSRLLLQNDVHDVTCGVSIDQVHEKAEDIYRQVFEGAAADVETSLNAIFQGFAPGRYAVTTNPLPAVYWVHNRDRIHMIETAGIGITPLEEGEPIATLRQKVDSFRWQSDHYGSVIVRSDGLLECENGMLGRLVLSADHGDTYSDETGAVLGEMLPVGLVMIESSSPHHAMLLCNYEFQNDSVGVSATVRIILDETPLIRWEIELDSTGVDFRVEMVFDTGVNGRVMAGMPFDVVSRPFVDTDFFPREAGETDRLLMGQRELNEVRSFPFHDFVGMDNGSHAAVIFAKGINCYRAYEGGTVALTLRRSVEWVTRANLKNRIGDAGPFFYVPDARCERVVKHEVAFAAGDFAIDSPTVQRLNAAYQNPPLLIEWGGSGERMEWDFLKSDAPMSSLQVIDHRPVARWFNPTPKRLEAIPSKKIVAAVVDVGHPVKQQPAAEVSGVRIFNLPAGRVGGNKGLPNPDKIAELRALAAGKEAAYVEAQARLAKAANRDVYILQHQVYIHHREMLEYLLSARLNELKRELGGQITSAYLYERDPEVAKIGWQLNQLRIKRRIYDYVVAALQGR